MLGGTVAACHMLLLLLLLLLLGIAREAGQRLCDGAPRHGTCRQAAPARLLQQGGRTAVAQLEA